MRDLQGRMIRYLRLSLTSACPMRCVYCRPAMLDNHGQRPVFSAEQIERLVRHLVIRHGLRKVRLTGGEPTARADLLEIVRRLSAIDGLEELTMTTNGLTLARQAQDLVYAGLHRVNVSLDSLDREGFRRLSGVDGLTQVIAGIDAALAAELSPVKLNAVVVRGENDSQLPQLLRFAAERRCEMRFIELMPMGPLADQWAQRYLPASDMRDILARSVEQWQPLSRSSESAQRFAVRLHGGLTGVVGFITPISCNFCAACDRLRISSDGSLYPCLMDKPAGNLLPAVQPAFRADEVDRLLEDALAQKAPQHPTVGMTVMIRIGG